MIPQLGQGASRASANPAASRSRARTGAPRGPATRLLVVLAALAALAATLVGPAGPAAAAEEPVAGQVDGQVSLLAVRGLDDQLWSRRSDERRWTPLGGVLTDVPALALDPVTRRAFYVVVGRDGLYVRTSEPGWGRLGPAGFRCEDPDAAVVPRSDGSRRLVVGCRGLDGRRPLVGVTAEVPDTGLPSGAQPFGLGGSLEAGPGVLAAGGGQAAFVVTGGAYVTQVDGRAVRANVYSRTESTGYVRENLSCDSAPSLAASVVASFVSCTFDRSLAWLWTGQDDERSVEGLGTTTGRTGPVAYADGSGVVYVEGVGNRLYVAEVLGDGRFGGFTALPGLSRGGVAGLRLAG